MKSSPLRCHFVWMGPPVPYYVRLAVESAAVNMPDAEIRLHLLGKTGPSRHLRAVSALRNVTIRTATLDEVLDGAPGGAARYQRVLDRVPKGSAAATTNLARLAILYAEGGVYLDTDVVVLRGLHDPVVHGDYLGREAVWADYRKWIESGPDLMTIARAAPWAASRLIRRGDAKFFRGRLSLAARLPEQITRLQVNNAVIGARPASTFLATALDRALEVDASKRFALGPALLDDVAKESPELVRLVPPSRFYAVPPGESFRYFEDATVELPADAQLIHYVSSNHRGLLRRLDENDPRFESHGAPFWVHGQHVRAQLGGSGERRRLRSVQ